MADTLGKALETQMEIELGGKKWAISPHTMGDLVEFEKNVIRTRIQNYLEFAADNVDADSRAKALIELSTIRPTEEMLEREMSTNDGVTYMLWIALRKTDPKLTLAETRKMSEDQAMQDYLAIQAGMNKETDENPFPGVTEEEKA